MNPTHLSRALRTRASLPYLLATLLAAGCASTAQTSSDLAAVGTAVRHGQYEEAVRIADTLRQERPGDPEVEEAHRLATVGFYLQRGRQATFRDDDVEALSWFRAALAIAPENPRVQEWIAKTRNKLADRWLEIGQGEYASDNLPAALEAYRNALSYRPEDESGLAGLGELTILVNYRNGLGVQYYDAGVRALSDYWLQRARRDFSATRKYLPENERAGRRITEVDVLLASQRVAVAEELESNSFFAGALNEFKFALALDPGNEEARVGIERVTVEADAAQFLRDAQMWIFRGEYDQALAALEEGEKLTVVQKELFQEAKDGITSARLQEMYDNALSKERDQRFEEAVAWYAKLLDEVDWFEDARARMDTLQNYIEQADAFYEKAMKATEPEEKLVNLRAIEVFWPEYKDIRLQIAKLEP